MEVVMIMEVVKNFAAICAIPASTFTVFVGIATVCVHWRTLFAPHKQRIYEEQFKIAMALMNELKSPDFLIFYANRSYCVNDRTFLRGFRAQMDMYSYSPFRSKAMGPAFDRLLRLLHEAVPVAPQANAEVRHDKTDLLLAQNEAYHEVLRFFKVHKENLPVYTMLMPVRREQSVREITGGMSPERDAARC